MLEAGKLEPLTTRDQVHEGLNTMVHCSLAINPASSPCITACVKNKIVKCMVDAGATVSLFKKTAWSQLEGVNCSLAPWEGHKLVGVEGSPVSVCGISTLQLDIAGTMFVSDFVVVDMLGVDCIIGSRNMEASLTCQRTPSNSDMLWYHWRR